MRAATLTSNPHGMLSRGISGVYGGTLIVNLPGFVSGVEESLAVVGPALRQAVDLLGGGSGSH